MMAAPAGGGGGDEAAAEKTEFDVILTGAGDKKIARHQGGPSRSPVLGLKEAKEIGRRCSKTFERRRFERRSRRSARRKSKKLAVQSKSSSVTKKSVILPNFASGSPISALPVQRECGKNVLTDRLGGLMLGCS